MLSGTGLGSNETYRLSPMHMSKRPWSHLVPLLACGRVLSPYVKLEWVREAPFNDLTCAKGERERLASFIA